MRERDNDELAELRFEAFQEWLADKRAQSTAYKYNRGADGFDVRGHHVVYTEFLEETGYENHELPLKATTEELGHLGRLREDLAHAQGRMREVRERYGIVDTDLLDMEDQYEDDSELGSPERDPVTGELWYA